VEEVSQSLRYQTTDLEQQTKTSESDINQIVDRIFRSDDKLLSSLQKLARDLDPVRSSDEDTVERIRDLCARLIKHTVEGIRTRLDRIYLQAPNSAPNGHEDDQESVDLQEELESLYSEILPVAQMSAEQQFLEPALREIAARDGQDQERSVKAVKYVRAPVATHPLLLTLSDQ
jgi:small-conductance mechanosensitive channel